MTVILKHKMKRMQIPQKLMYKKFYLHEKKITYTKLPLWIYQKFNFRWEGYLNPYRKRGQYKHKMILNKHKMIFLNSFLLWNCVALAVLKVFSNKPSWYKDFLVITKNVSNEQWNIVIFIIMITNLLKLNELECKHQIKKVPFHISSLH